MSRRLEQIGSIYGSRFLNRNIFKLYGLPKEQRIQHKQWPIVAGDQVQVIEGPEKGKVGQVMFVKRQNNQIVIKDVNVNIRTKRRTQLRAGYFYRTESPIHYTNVQLIDPVHNKPCKIRYGKDEVGKSVRYSTLSGAVIPKNKVDYVKKDKSKRMNKVLDTKPEDVWDVTFKPFTKNWRPKWEYREQPNAQEQQYNLKMARLNRFEKEYAQTPIAHV